MNIYTTSDIAKRIGIHPNTVRFYEKMQLITANHYMRCRNLMYFSVYKAFQMGINL